MRLLKKQIHSSWQRLTNGSTNRQIFGAAIIIAFGTLFVKLAAFLKELIVGWTFGVGDEQDAFLIALMVPGFISNVLAISSFGTALIPTYVQVREQQGNQAAQKLLSTATMLGLGLLAIASLLMIVTAPLYLPLIAAGFTPSKLKLTWYVLCAISPSIIITGTSVIWGAVLNARERFAIAAITPIATPIITIILLLEFKSLSIFNLALGLVCGALVEAIILGIVLQKQGIYPIPKWYGYNPQLRQIVNQYLPTIAGALLMCSAGVIDQVMAAKLPSGSVAALNYGNRIIAASLSLISTALTTAVVPYFSKMAAAQNWLGLRKTLNSYVQFIFLLIAPLSALIIIFSQPLTSIFFQRGSFSASDTQIVSEIQSFFALQMPFYLSNFLLIKLITSINASSMLMWGATYNLIINIVLNYIFMHWLGVRGIALSTSCVYLFSFFYLFFVAIKQLDNLSE